MYAAIEASSFQEPYYDTAQVRSKNKFSLVSTTIRSPEKPYPLPGKFQPPDPQSSPQLYMRPRCFAILEYIYRSRYEQF